MNVLHVKLGRKLDLLIVVAFLKSLATTLVFTRNGVRHLQSYPQPGKRACPRLVLPAVSQERIPSLRLPEQTQPSDMLCLQERPLSAWSSLS